MPKFDIHRRRCVRAIGLASMALLIPGSALGGNIRELDGAVFINRRRARPDSEIRPGDMVTTSHNGRIAFTVGGDAFLVKARSSLQVGEVDNPVISALQLLTGRLLSVFEAGPRRRIVTANATIGIRGTACFLDTRPSSLYYCNCYGETELTAGGTVERFEAVHHDAHQIDFDGGEMMGMRVMAVLDHDDDELRLLEGYLGRIPPFDRI